MDEKLSEETQQNGEVEVTTEAAQGESVDQANALLDIEQTINSTLSRIETLTQEISKQNEMLTSVLENDETYRNHEEAAKEANRVKNATKKEVMKRGDVAHVAEKAKELKAEMKDVKDSLSSYLYEYARISGQNEFEAQDGTVRKIVYSAKLVKQ